ncbi:MAG: CesT family type III secretion system chaperone [Chlamydiia bacterium]|nr:CesT family type III secretion system chaperone [Chlamydiia bacterium]
MGSSTFNRLCKEFGDRLQINLDPEDKDYVSLTLPDGCHLLITEYPSSGRFLVQSVIGDIDAGPYRINVLQKALQFNHQTPPRAGTFGFSRKKSLLVFWRDFDLETTTAERLLDCLVDYSFVVTSWREDITRGRVPDFTLQDGSEEKRPRAPGLFGLRP